MEGGERKGSGRRRCRWCLTAIARSDWLFQSLFVTLHTYTGGTNCKLSRRHRRLLYTGPAGDIHDGDRCRLNAIWTVVQVKCRVQTISQSSSSAQQNWQSRMSDSPTRAPQMAHLAARDRRTQGKVADADFFIHDPIRKVVPSACHRADKDGNVVRFGQGRQVPRQPHRGCVARQGCIASAHAGCGTERWMYSLSLTVFAGR